jgi:hypothetical protein
VTDGDQIWAEAMKEEETIRKSVEKSVESADVLWEEYFNRIAQALDVSPSPCHFASIEDFIHDIEYGGETDIVYDGHRYFVTGLYEAWEQTKNRDGVYCEFKNADDMLDNFKVHTGESLREIAVKCGLVNWHSRAKVVYDEKIERAL